MTLVQARLHEDLIDRENLPEDLREQVHDQLTHQLFDDGTDDVEAGDVEVDDLGLDVLDDAEDDADESAVVADKVEDTTQVKGKRKNPKGPDDADDEPQTKVPKKNTTPATLGEADLRAVFLTRDAMTMDELLQAIGGSHMSTAEDIGHMKRLFKRYCSSIKQPDGKMLISLKKD